MGWGYCRYNLVSVIIDAWLATCVRNKSNILLANKYWHDYDWFYVTSPFLFVWKFFPHLCKTLWCKEIGFRYVFSMVLVKVFLFVNHTSMCSSYVHQVLPVVVIDIPHASSSWPKSSSEMFSMFRVSKWARRSRWAHGTMSR